MGRFAESDPPSLSTRDTSRNDVGSPTNGAGLALCRRGGAGPRPSGSTGSAGRGPKIDRRAAFSVLGGYGGGHACLPSPPIAATSPQAEQPATSLWLPEPALPEGYESSSPRTPGPAT
jgi:hypothetical protein